MWRSIATGCIASRGPRRPPPLWVCNREHERGVAAGFVALHTDGRRRMSQSELDRGGVDRRITDSAGWRRLLPGLDTLRRYEATWLPHDLGTSMVASTSPATRSCGSHVAS